MASGLVVVVRRVRRVVMASRTLAIILLHPPSTYVHALSRRILSRRSLSTASPITRSLYGVPIIVTRRNRSSMRAQRRRGCRNGRRSGRRD